MSGLCRDDELGKEKRDEQWRVFILAVANSETVNSEVGDSR